MKFYEYLDILYVNRNIQLSKGFDLKVQAETRAIPVLMDMQRKYFRVVAYFKFTLGFAKAKLTGVYPIRAELPKMEPVKPEPLKVVDNGQST